VLAGAYLAAATARSATRWSRVVAGNGQFLPEAGRSGHSPPPERLVAGRLMPQVQHWISREARRRIRGAQWTGALALNLSDLG
jgi:hypothetical protein